jgi:hypothetical protein
LKGIVDERAIKLGEHIVENKDTVRHTAAKFGISKSTVHTEVTKRRGPKGLLLFAYLTNMDTFISSAYHLYKRASIHP